MIDHPLESIPQIGPVTADKLKKEGYHTLQKIAVAPPDEIATITDTSERVAETMIAVARAKLGIVYFSGHAHFTDDEQPAYTGAIVIMPNGWVYLSDQGQYVPRTQIKEITNE